MSDDFSHQLFLFDLFERNALPVFEFADFAFERSDFIFEFGHFIQLFRLLLTIRVVLLSDSNIKIELRILLHFLLTKLSFIFNL